MLSTFSKKSLSCNPAGLDIACGQSDAYELVIIRRSEAVALLVLVGKGDARARVILETFQKMIVASQPALGQQQARCVSCDRPPLGQAFSGAVALEMRSGPDQRVRGFIVCETCAKNVRSIRAKATAAFQRIWPTSRLIEPTHPAAKA